MSNLPGDDASVSATLRERWEGGAVVDFALDAHQPLMGWSVVVDVEGRVVNLWNAVLLTRDGSRYTLGAMDYNTSVPAGTTVSFGMQVAGPGTVDVLAVEATHAAAAAAATTVAPPAPIVPPAPPPAPTSDVPRGPGEPEPVASSPETPTLAVSSPTLREPTGRGDGLPRDVFAPGRFATDGAAIVDAAGERADIRGINWFGFETETFALHGLWARNWREVMDEVKSLGFNTLRLPFSGDFARLGSPATGIDHGLNPDLRGLSGLEVMDAVVRYADTIGLRIILDYHRGTPGGGPNESGLWYGAGRTEADVIAEWRTVAERYRDAPAVIGADLINEPHLATWGDGSATDWAAAAERIGNAVLDVAPDWLVIVEGVAVHRGDTYWWGGNLQGVAERPVELAVPNRLVYSPHDYPPSVSDQPFFRAGTPLEDVWRKNWGYLVEEARAPVLLGEWGSRLDTPGDVAWADALSDYLTRTGTPWLWWAVNPNSRDTGGLFADDWATVRPEVLRLLGPALAATRPELGLADRDLFAAATFAVTLAEPAQTELVVAYATADGSATAGTDYVATAGTLTFAPGETAATIAVPLLPDAAMEGDEAFDLVLSGDGSVLATGMVTIVDDDRERRSGMMAPLPVDVADAAGRGGSSDGRPDDAPERRLSLAPTAAAAAIRAGGKEAFGAPGPAHREATDRDATAVTAATIELILANDWGPGALEAALRKRPAAEDATLADLPTDLVDLLLAAAGEPGPAAAAVGALIDVVVGTVLAAADAELNF